MTFDEIVGARWSVRAYDGRSVPREHIVAMMEAARLAPSASNSQPWRFVAVTDKRVLAQLCRKAMGPVIKNRWLRQAPLVIVGCARLDFVANTLGSYVTGIDYYPIDFGIAMEHAVLKATELGLGTCWIGWIDAEKTREILGIPEGIRVLAMLAVGYAKEAPPKTRPRKPLDAIVFEDHWGRPFAATCPGGTA